MNSCILMAQVVSNPELRSTQDQTSVSTMMVEFAPSREGEDPGKVQVEGWGNLAEEIKSTYNVGDRIIIEGRLSMNLFEMPEGYKEKRAKLVASKIYAVSGSDAAGISGGGQNFPASENFSPSPQPTPVSSASSENSIDSNSDNTNNEDWDEIPF